VEYSLSHYSSDVSTIIHDRVTVATYVVGFKVKNILGGKLFVQLFYIVMTYLMAIFITGDPLVSDQ